MKKSCDKCLLVKMCNVNDAAKGLTYQRGVSHLHDGMTANEFKKGLKILIAEYCSFYKEDNISS